MDKLEAAERLRELADQIYCALEDMRGILMEVAPRELLRAELYWMAHIDGALENRNGVLGGSFVSLIDTLEELEKEKHEE